MEHGETLSWRPEQLRLKPLQLIVSWVISAAALEVTAWILPGVHINDLGGAFIVAAVVGAVNAVVPPIFAALRLPFTLVVGFVLTLLLNAVVLQLADAVLTDFDIDDFGWALLAAIVMTAVAVALEVLFSANDDDTYTLQVVQRVAKRQGG